MPVPAVTKVLAPAGTVPATLLAASPLSMVAVGPGRLSGGPGGAWRWTAAHSRSPNWPSCGLQKKMTNHGLFEAIWHPLSYIVHVVLWIAAQSQAAAREASLLAVPCGALPPTGQRVRSGPVA